MSWLSAAIGAVGGLFGQKASAKSAEANAELQAKLQRENWEYMQKNAHQFEAQDLTAAGLNPILSATNGQIASAPSVSGGDNGVGANVTNAFTAISKGILEEELKNKELDNDSKRIEIEQKDFDLKRDMADYQKKLYDAEARKYGVEADYMTGKNAREISLNDAQIKEIDARISNSTALTNAQISKLHSGIALDSASIDKLAAETKKVIEDTNLSYWQKQQLISSISDQSAALRRMTAQQQLEYLSTSYGEVSNKFGYSLKLINPLSGFGVSSSGNYGGRF